MRLYLWRIVLFLIGIAVVSVGVIHISFNTGTTVSPDDKLLHSVINLEKENKLLKDEIILLKSDLKKCNLQVSVRTYTDAPKLKDSSFGTNYKRDESHILIKDRGQFEKKVTLIVYRSPLYSASCFKNQIDSIKQNFPQIKILHDVESRTVGQAFNSMSGNLQTDYFLFLNSGVMISKPGMDSSVSWLLLALENIPELDFVSGSVLEGDYLYTPCYRLRHCDWTFSQSYEFEQSVGNLMICEEIASSFLGRTSSLQKLPGQKFDPNLELFSTTDFFLRAKRAGLKMAALPEVMFEVKSSCVSEKMDTKEKLNGLFPFAFKHRILRFKDVDGKTTDICDVSEDSVNGKRSEICSETNAHKNFLKGSGHWIYAGVSAYPYIRTYLQEGVKQMDQFLNEKGLKYFIDAGVALGALKMRKVIPWDSGDVDLGVYIESTEVLFKMMTEELAKKKGVMVDMCGGNQICVFFTPKHIGKKHGGVVTVFAHPEEPKPTIRMKVGDVWASFHRSIISDLRRNYGITYLQHRMYDGKQNVHCLAEGETANACLPDFRNIHSGRGGTFREYFCDI